MKRNHFSQPVVAPFVQHPSILEYFIGWMLGSTFFVGLLLMLSSVATRAQTLDVIYRFSPGTFGAGLRSGLAESSDGKFYGATDEPSGSIGYGMVFKVTRSGLFTTVAPFTSADGTGPSTLVLAADGNFYGTTYRGGSGGFGTVFQVTPDGLLTTLLSFRGSDGANPYAGLLLGPDGNLYGTTFYGGHRNAGTVFKLNSTASLTTLVSFGGIPDQGEGPGSRLTLGNDDYLYGTTAYGGSLGYGTIFRITTNGEFATLKSLRQEDGSYPAGELAMGPDGSLYGTTSQGGLYDISSGGNGTVFKIATNGTFTTLMSFDGTNGANPLGGLVLGNDGCLYGTTAAGNGTIFKVTTNGQVTSLVHFTGANGASPRAALHASGDGYLYGTTIDGVIFRFNPRECTNTAPINIIQSPRPLIVVEGSSNALSVIATGSAPEYQWYRGDEPLDEETNSMLVVSSASWPDDDADYFVVVRNCVGAITSAVAHLTVRIPPQILLAPQSQSIQSGDTVGFTVGIRGQPAPALQWYFNGTNAIAGATNSFFVITNAQSDHSGFYSVLATNVAGSALSPFAILTVGLTGTNQPGMLDPSFDPKIGPDSYVGALAVQADGKVLIGGAFTNVGGIRRPGLARLNTDGSVDTAFDTGSGIAGEVRVLAIDRNGQVLVGGRFTNFNGIARNHLVRLRPDGRLDFEFLASLPESGWINTISIDPFGQILIGGNITNVSGLRRSHLARLDANGYPAVSFSPILDGEVYSLALSPDGNSILACGAFRQVNGIRCTNVAQFSRQGVLTSTPLSVSGGEVLCVAYAGTLPVIAGSFSHVNTTPMSNIAKLNLFTPTEVLSDFQPSLDGPVYAVLPQADRTLLMAGRFTAVGGRQRRGIARLLENPVTSISDYLDSTFNPQSGANDSINALASGPDGSIFAAGTFTTFNGMSRPYVARLLGSQRIVSITSSSIVQDTSGLRASFTVSRTGPTGAPLTVNLSSRTALSSQQFRVTIPSGESATTVFFPAVYATASNAAISLAVSPGSAYVAAPQLPPAVTLPPWPRSTGSVVRIPAGEVNRGVRVALELFRIDKATNDSNQTALAEREISTSSETSDSQSTSSIDLGIEKAALAHWLIGVYKFNPRARADQIQTHLAQAQAKYQAQNRVPFPSGASGKKLDYDPIDSMWTAIGAAPVIGGAVTVVREGIRWGQNQIDQQPGFQQVQDYATAVEVYHAQVARRKYVEEKLMEFDVLARQNPEAAKLRDALGLTPLPPPGTDARQILAQERDLAAQPTMQLLQELLDQNGDLVVSQEQMKQLFGQQLSALNELTSRNLAMLEDLQASQLELLQYSRDFAAQQRDQQMAEAARQDRELTIRAADSSFYLLQTFVGFLNPRLANQIGTVGRSAVSLAEGVNNFLAGSQDLRASMILSANAVSAFVSVMSAFDDTPSTDQQILQGIAELKQMISDLGRQMHERFDRIDESLNQIYSTLVQQFANIDLQLGILRGEVSQIQSALYTIQSQLNRMEKNIYQYFNDEYRKDFVTEMNKALGYRETTGQPIPWATFVEAENIFYTWATYNSLQETLSGVSTRCYEDDACLANDLSNYPPPSNLNYVLRYTDLNLSSPGLPRMWFTTLANPQDWAIGAEAYMQLCADTPAYFRNFSSNHLETIIATGVHVRDALSRITLLMSNGTPRANLALFGALFENYRAKAVQVAALIRQSEAEFKTNIITDGILLPYYMKLDLWGRPDQWTGWIPPNGGSFQVEPSAGGYITSPLPISLPISALTNLFPKVAFLGEMLDLGSITFTFGQQTLRNAVYGSGGAPYDEYASYTLQMLGGFKLATGSVPFFTLMDNVYDSGQSYEWANCGTCRSFDAAAFFQFIWTQSHLYTPCYGCLGSHTVGPLRDRFMGISWSQLSPESKGYQTFQLENYVIRELQLLQARYYEWLSNRLVTAAGSPLLNAISELNGAKGLIDSYVALGLSLTLENDDLLRSLLYGKDRLPDGDAIREICVLAAAEAANGSGKKVDFADIFGDRIAGLEQVITNRLAELEEAGVPEPLRMVDSTLRRLEVFRLLHGAAPVPPILSTMRHASGMVHLTIEEEPSISVTVEESFDFRTWIPITTSAENGDILEIAPASAGSDRKFYRGKLGSTIFH